MYFVLLKEAMVLSSQISLDLGNENIFDIDLFS